MSSHPRGYISPCEFNACVGKMREFFLSKGFVEVHTQNRMSILAACEDPDTIATYDYAGQVWPLPQTGQMWLEYELLKNPSVPGYFCVSTSYRNEPNPVPGRHEIIFPMFEFELKGDMDAMVEMEKELLTHLGFDKFHKTEAGNTEYPEGDYEDVAREYGVEELENEHELRLKDDHGPVFFLKNFPNHTSPFWNMRQHDDGVRAKKVDVIVNGMETIGSAERSCSPEEMRKMFATISDGEYAGKLYRLFGQERVDTEMDEFLSFEFFPRSGGGIGVTRMISAMKEHGLM
jgi:aspartyl/asparaginyl-tRNA synthetase